MSVLPVALLVLWTRLLMTAVADLSEEEEAAQ